MFVLMRAIVFAALFMGLVLFLLPAQILSRAGLAPPEPMGAQQIVGIVVAIAGLVVALWCILVFAVVGRGTPAPFDPPRRLVVRGPYVAVRNPMYIGAGLVLAGASLFYESLALLAYAGAFFLVTHGFVVLYEEPTLRSSFGADYNSYCRDVGRWWPQLRKRGRAGAG